MTDVRQLGLGDLIEGSVVSGRIDVPDLVIARYRGLSERSDLAERDFGEGHRALVFVEKLDQEIFPRGRPCGRPAAIT